MAAHDPYNLARFVAAQQSVYEDALAELREGYKLTHWMWFIFPQIDGLGQSSMSRYYSIKSEQEARQYLAHPVLGPRLLECAEAVLAIQGESALDIFGSPDDMKLRSSMTLFACLSRSPSVFTRVLDKYFEGRPDRMTLRLLRKLST